MSLFQWKHFINTALFSFSVGGKKQKWHFWQSLGNYRLGTNHVWIHANGDLQSACWHLQRWADFHSETAQAQMSSKDSQTKAGSTEYACADSWETAWYWTSSLCCWTAFRWDHRGGRCLGNQPVRKVMATGQLCTVYHTHKSKRLEMNRENAITYLWLPWLLCKPFNEDVYV